MQVHSEFVDAVNRQSTTHPNRVAYLNSAGECMTYAELAQRSDALACWLSDPSNVNPKVPVVLYGHKSPYMLVGMIACGKSGHPYVPIDTIYPTGRVSSIVKQLEDEAGMTVMLDTRAPVTENTSPHFDSVKLIDYHNLTLICSRTVNENDICTFRGVEPEEAFYILFTSGSTGDPKGVVMPGRYVDYFSRWLCNFYRTLATAEERNHGLVWFNRSPFTFDLSTDDLFCGLVSGDTVFALEEEAESSMRKTFDCLASSGVTDWISTPSFVDACLADPSFNSSLLPNLRRVMLAGEALHKDTVLSLRERFPNTIVLNNYGPTETGTCTICVITDEMLNDERPLPIGYAGPEAELHILDRNTLTPVEPGNPGELYVVGNVGLGYWGRPELTEAGFHSCPQEVALGRPSYRTGDECIVDKNGLTYCLGRLDDMIKLHGYRIEPAEIESALSQLPEVAATCVLPDRTDDGTVRRLVAVVQPSSTATSRGLTLTRALKHQIGKTLPAYMVPATFRYVDTMPLNPNGKIDRKNLAMTLGV